MKPGKRIIQTPHQSVQVIVAACFAFLLVIDISGTPPDLPQNPALLEAQSIIASGSVELPLRVHDTAVEGNRVRNAFQPGETLVFLAHLVSAGDSALRAWKVELFGVFVLSSVLIAMALARFAGSAFGVAFPITASVMLGAPYIASLPRALSGAIHRSNHVFAILFIASALFLLSKERSKRQLWLVGASVGAAMLFRAQNVLLLAIPLCFLFQDGDSWSVSERLRTADARGRLLADTARLLAGPIVAVVLILGFNFARFGSPFENGYLAIYEGRNDYLALRAREYGVWSLHFLSENIRRTLFAWPSLSFAGSWSPSVQGDPLGNSLLFSQPFLLLGCFLWRGLRNARVQAFLLGGCLLAIPVLTYHNPGLEAPGYMRYSLDYLFPFAAAMAVAARQAPRRGAWTVGLWILSAWAVYFGVSLLRGPVVT